MSAMQRIDQSACGSTHLGKAERSRQAKTEIAGDTCDQEHNTMFFMLCRAAAGHRMYVEHKHVICLA